MTPSTSRLRVIAAAVLYTATFHLAYQLYLASFFQYNGFAYDPLGTGFLLLGWALAVLPAAWLPAGVYQPTQLTYWLLYTTVYVPSLLVPVYTGRLEAGELTPLLFSMAAGFAIVGAFRKLKPLQIRRRPMSPLLFRLALLVPAVLGFCYLVAKFHSQFQLVGFGSVYEQRAAANATMGTFDRYVIIWLATGFNPFFMTYGLFRRRPLWLLLGAGGQVLLYAFTALKSALLMPAIYLALYSSVCKQRTLGVRVAVASAAVLIAACGLYFASGAPWSIMVAAIVVMRTFGLPGLSTLQYYQFFTAHSLTYFSQVHGVSLLIPYPYARAVYYEIGDAFYANPELTANAHFWAQDGLSSLALPGVLIMSVLCGLVFWLFDSLGELAGRPFVTLLLVATGMQLTNGSLFTALTSGGGMLLAFYVLFMPREENACRF